MTTLFMDVDTALGIEGGDIDDALAIAYLAGQPEWAGLVEFRWSLGMLHSSPV